MANRKKMKWCISVLLICSIVLQTMLMNVPYILTAEGSGGEENFTFTDVKIYADDGTEIASGSNADMAKPVTIRYSFSIRNAGRPGDSLSFQIPDQLAIYDAQKFNLVDTDTNLKFAELRVDTTGNGTITLLDDSRLLSNLEGWFQIKTFWDYGKVPEGGQQELTFILQDKDPYEVTVHAIPIQVSADVKIKKEGSVQGNGEILWRITVTPETNPARYPVSHVKVTDVIPLDQDFVANSWTVEKAASGASARAGHIAAYGFIRPRQEEAVTATASSSATASSPAKLLRSASAAKAAVEEPEAIWEEKDDFLYEVKDAGREERGEASPSNATASDSQSRRPVLKSRAALPKTILLPGFRTASGASDLSGGFNFKAPDTDPNTGNEINHGTVEYKFPIAIQDPYVITFRTKTNEEGMQAAGSVGESGAPGYPGGRPSMYHFKNTALVTWPKDAVSDPETPGTSHQVIGSRPADAVLKYPITYITKNGEVMSGADGIKWTIRVNPNGLSLKEGTYLKDTIRQPDYVILALDEDGKEKVYYETAGGGQTQLLRCPAETEGLASCALYDRGTGRCSDEGHFTYSAHTLQYTVTGEKTPGNFIYYTKIDPKKYADAGYPSIENGVELGHGGGLYGQVSAEPVYPVMDWIAKTGRYNASSHRFTWTVTINAKSQALKNAVFTDVLNLDESKDSPQKYVSGTFRVDGAEKDPSSEFTSVENASQKTQTLSYSFGNIREQHTITFDTEVLKASDYQTNTTGTYTNRASLEAVYEGDTLKTDSSAQVRAPSEVIAKAAVGSYDHVKNVLTWKITINGNRMPIKNAVVTDVLPEGQTLLMKADASGEPDVTVKKIDASGAEVEPSPAPTVQKADVGGLDKLTVTFSDPITDTYAITVKTQLTDAKKEEWFKNANGILEVNNKASLAGDEFPEADSNKCVQRLENSILKKIAIYEDGDNFIKWRVLMNQHGMSIPLESETGAGDVTSVYLEDALDENLKLDLGSVKLYEGVPIKADGSYDLYAAEVISYSSDDVDPIKKLTYGEKNDGFTKNIYYEVAPSGGCFRFSFTGKKGDGQPLAPIKGAAGSQTIFGDKAYVLEFVTDVLKPEVTIKNSISLKGTGQASTSDNQEVRYSVGEGGGSGRRATIQIEKVDKYDHSMKLSGAEFSLYDKSARAADLGIDDEPVVKAIGDGDGGKLTYPMLYFNNKYELLETKAPSGYKQVPADGWHVDITGSGQTVNPGENAPTSGPEHGFEMKKDQLSTGGLMKVTVENTPKLGWVSIKKTGSTQDISLKGAEFTVYKENKRTVAKQYTDPAAPDGGAENAVYVTGDDGVAYIDGLRCGIYYLKETKTPENYAADGTYYRFEIPDTITEDYVRSAYTDGTKGSFQGGGTLPYEIKNTPVGSIELLKEDTATRQPLNGAHFALYTDEACENLVRQATTDSDGKAKFANLPAGEYYVKETAAPNGYRLEKAPVHVTLELKKNGNTERVVLVDPLTGNEISRVIVKNTPVGSITVTKKASDTGKKLSGAEFTLYTDAECTTLAGAAAGLAAGKNPVRTDGNGVAKFVGLNLGTYYIKETKRPAGYKINKAVLTCELTRAGQSLSKAVDDDPVLAAVKVKKIDSFTRDVVPGVEILLKNAAGTYSTTRTTGDDGYAVFKDLPIGTYYATEKKAPEGYVKNENAEITLEVKDDDSVTVVDRDTDGQPAVIENDPIGSFLFRKVDSVTGRPLEGAKIRLTPQNAGISGGGSQEKQTGEDGTCLFENLLYGDYLWEEIEAPDGYLLGDPRPSGLITIDKNTEPVELSEPLANRPLPKFRFQIRKTGDPDGRLLDGATYEVREKNAPDQLVASAETVNGIADLGILYKGITYYYQEVSAPSGYRLDPKQYEFTVEDDGSDKIVTETRTVRDELAKGSFTLRKADSSPAAAPIAGVNFRLGYLGTGTAGVDDESMSGRAWEKQTGADGFVTFDGLPLGRYRVEELSAPPEYHVDRSWSYEFELTADGENASFSAKDSAGNPIDYLVNDDAYTGGLVITKTDSGNPASGGALYQPLSGAKIGVFLKSGGQPVAESVTDAGGKASFQALREGDYYYQELEAPEGYALDETKYPFTIGKEGGVPSGKPVNGLVLERTMRNRLISGTVTVAKTDSFRGNPLSGAVFALFSEAGEKLAEAVTDDAGKAVFEDLRKGNYYIQELKAPSGYVLDETQHPFAIAKVEERIELSIQNRRVPSGGDDSGNGGGGSVPESPKQPTDPPTTEYGPGQPSEPESPAETLPSESGAAPSEPGNSSEAAPPPTEVPREPDGTITITPPDVPAGGGVIITTPDGTEVFRGVPSENGDIKADLPPGNYNLITVDENGVPLAGLIFTVEDQPVPLAAPDAGDGSISLAFLIAILLCAVIGIVALLRARSGLSDNAGGNGDLHENK